MTTTTELVVKSFTSLCVATQKVYTTYEKKVTFRKALLEFHVTLQAYGIVVNYLKDPEYGFSKEAVKLLEIDMEEGLDLIKKIDKCKGIKGATQKVLKYLDQLRALRDSFQSHTEILLPQHILHTAETHKAVKRMKKQVSQLAGSGFKTDGFIDFKHSALDHDLAPLTSSRESLRKAAKSLNGHSILYKLAAPMDKIVRLTQPLLFDADFEIPIDIRDSLIEKLKFGTENITRLVGTSSWRIYKQSQRQQVTVLREWAKETVIFVNEIESKYGTGLVSNPPTVEKSKGFDGKEKEELLEEVAGASSKVLETTVEQNSCAIATLMSHVVRSYATHGELLRIISEEMEIYKPYNEKEPRSEALNDYISASKEVDGRSKIEKLMENLDFIVGQNSDEDVRSAAVSLKKTLGDCGLPGLMQMLANDEDGNLLVEPIVKVAHLLH